MISERERKNRDELFRLMKENPDLPVVWPTTYGQGRRHGDGEIGGAVWKNRLTYAHCAASA